MEDWNIQVYSFKQCSSSLPFFQCVKQTHEADGVITFSGNSALLQSNGNWKRALLPENVITPWASCICLTRKKGRELVHCLYEKARICLPTSRRPGNPTGRLKFKIDALSFFTFSSLRSQRLPRAMLRSGLVHCWMEWSHRCTASFVRQPPPSMTPAMKWLSSRQTSLHR